MKLLLSTIVTVASLALVSPAGASSSRHSWHLGQWDPGIHNTQNAVYYEFCGHHYVYCSAGYTAWRITGCEAGPDRSLWAQNGEHLGLFQMGEYERRRFGHGISAWVQSRAARLYYLISGWSPWYSSRSCWG